MSREEKKKRLFPELSDRQSLWFWLVLAAALVVVTAFFAVSCSRNDFTAEDAAIPRSLVRRTRLRENAVTETGYYTDHLDWLGKNNETALKGLRYFYKQTGVQPYVFLTNNLGLEADQPDRETLQRYAEELYDGLFQDQGHLLLVIFENRRHEGTLFGFVTGTAAAGVMDEEALSILEAYLDTALRDGQHYPQGSRDKMISDVFEKTARNIMSVKDRTGWIAVLVLLVTVMLAVAAVDFGKAWKKVREQEQAKEKAEKAAGSESSVKLSQKT